MLRLGAVTIDVSHPAGFAGKFLSMDGNPARYVAVFNDGFRSDEEVAEFAEQFGVKIYDDLDEMIDNIDLGFVHCCNWDKHLDYVMHFVRKGKPVFVDKPIVGNLADCEKILELSRSGAKILGTSALRYAFEVVETREAMKKDGVNPVLVTTSVGCDDFNYCIHGVEALAGIIDCSPVSCRYIGRSCVDKEGVESYMVRYENGTSGIYNSFDKKFALCSTTVLTDKAPLGDYCFAINNMGLYDAMLPRIIDYMNGKEDSLITVEQMVESIKVLLAGKASKLNGGIEVSLDDPILREVSFDGYAFEEEYAANARAARAAAKAAK